MAEPVPDRTMQLNLYCVSDSNNCILWDQATVVGVISTDCNTIAKQNITDHSVPVVTYTANIGQVYTLAVDEASNLLFAGNYNHGRGQVVQYDLSTGQAIKNYGQVGIGSVLSSARVDNLWLFGGFTFKITAIDSVSRRVVHTPVATAIGDILSMTVCNAQNDRQDSKVLLYIFGEFLNYSDGRTDVFDISGLVDKFAISPSDCSPGFTARSKSPVKQA